MAVRSGLSRAEARRIALAAQGFAEPRPRGRIDRGHLRRVIARIGLVQIDSVNVLARSHYLPFFSRLGPYPMALLDDLAYKRRELVEQWAHEASLLPIEHYPLLRHRMEATNRRSAARIEDGQPGYLDAILAFVRERGPVTVGDLEGERRRGGWWGWSDGKIALEHHFARGALAIADRRNFARLYDLPERVLPPSALNGAPPREEQQRELLRMSARALGVGTASDLADYYRLKITVARPLIEELADAGELVRVAVEGWRQPTYLHPDARIPRQVNARALLSPFDSLVWERDRNQRLFDFHYRIEIYTPEPKRVFGYYVLPFLLGDRLVARVDLKADRQAGALLVQAAHLEAGASESETAAGLAAELYEMATWLGLGRVEVASKGDLAAALRREVPAGRPLVR